MPAIGDVVYLASGSPALTVTQLIGVSCAEAAAVGNVKGS
jgi:uncharacterized protein YodC (DUF2158 family)